jgi:hypothetical protein
MTGSPNVLEFRSSDTTHRPAIEALELIGRYAAAGNLSYCPPGEHVPAHPELCGNWEPLVIRPISVAARPDFRWRSTPTAI